MRKTLFTFLASSTLIKERTLPKSAFHLCSIFVFFVNITNARLRIGMQTLNSLGTTLAQSNWWHCTCGESNFSRQILCRCCNAPREDVSEETAPATGSCVVCLTATATMTPPCGHLCMCADCADEVSAVDGDGGACPVCRTLFHMCELRRTFLV